MGVSDFGLSRVKEEEDEGTKMTNKVGTAHWMAPEVYHGTTYDEKVDVYSYAMVMYEILCRTVPYDAFEAPQVGPLIMKGVRPELRFVPNDCLGALCNLMIVCWDHNPRS